MTKKHIRKVNGRKIRKKKTYQKKIKEKRNRVQEIENFQREK